MKISRPSPSLVVSIIALVVACAGTATAAGVLITKSSQIKSNVITGAKIKSGSVTSSDIKDGTITSKDLRKGTKLGASSVGGSSDVVATEAVRKVGPTKQKPGQALVATMSQLAPGTYVLLAKSTISTDVANMGLLFELLKPDKTINAECILAAGGDQDNGRAGIASPGSQSSPSTVNLQMTRTIDTPTDVTLTCNVNDVNWQASDTSIIAIKVGGSSRTDVVS
jgi:hypothetical protein